MSVDAGKVSSLYAYVQDIVGAPIRVAIASVMLFELIGWSFAVGLVAQVCSQSPKFWNFLGSSNLPRYACI